MNKKGTKNLDAVGASPEAPEANIQPGTQNPPEAAPGEEAKTGTPLPHDETYKFLLSKKEVMTELLREFFPSQYVDKLDFDTMERAFENHSTENSEGELKRSSQDMVWKIRYGDSWACIYVMLEAQSSPNPRMLSRIMHYSMAMIDDLESSGQVVDGAYPAVFPIVYYSGKGK